MCVFLSLLLNLLPRLSDADESGTIDKAELEKLLTDLHFPLSETEGLFEAADADQDGVLQWGEFVTYCECEREEHDEEEECVEGKRMCGGEGGVCNEWMEWFYRRLCVSY